MSIYYTASGEAREIDDALYAQWVASGNPKAGVWTLRPDPPAYDPNTQIARWQGTQWIIEELPPPPVPEAVEPHKLAIVLDAAGLLAIVDAYVAAQSSAVQIAWNRSPSIRRASPMVLGAQTTLGLTDAQVDDLFRSAANLVT